MDTKVFTFPENGNNDLATLLAVNGNRGLGGNGWGAGLLGFIIGALINGNGFFGNGIGGNGAAANEAVMNAINGTDADVRSLSNMINADVNETRNAIGMVQAAIGNLATANSMGFAQVISALQNGNATLARQLCECCCENRLLTTQQGYENRIANLEQTNQLRQQADNDTRSIIDAISDQTAMMTKEFCDIREREMQSKINDLTADNAILRTTLNNNAQTAQFAAMLAPINAELAAIKASQPPTVTLPLNQYTAVPTLLATGASDFIASYWANRLTQATATPTTTPTSTTNS